MHVVIIGGVAAGMSAAAKLRREAPDVRVTVYERSGVVSYGACGLPYFIAGYTPDWHSLIVRPAEAFVASGVDVRLFHEVTEVVPASHQIAGRRLDTGDSFSDTYDRLLIATGANPVMPPFPGIGLPGVHSLKTIADAIEMRDILMKPETREAVVIGGGYIGLEVVEAILARGKPVTCIEAGSQVLLPFEPEIASVAVDALQRHGARVQLDERVTAIHGGDRRVCCVETNAGRYDADLVIVAIGVRPATGFLAGSGIALAPNGAIVVDREMRTSDPDIYAAGDCAEVYHQLYEANQYIPLATTANKCGRLVAGNLLGGHDRFGGTLGSAAIKVMDRQLARTGLSERDCRLLGLNWHSQVVEVPNHPAYYPGQETLRFKLIADRATHRLLGAQAAGAEGAVLRIDMLSVAIENRMATEGIGQMDLCYAPPFSGVWDAVLVAANAMKYGQK